MNEEPKIPDPLHITEEMRKAGVLALVETELKSGTESDIVERVHRAMVRTRLQDKETPNRPA